MKLYSSKQLSEKSVAALGAAGFNVTMAKRGEELVQGEDLKKIIADYDVVMIKLYQKLTAGMLDAVKGRKIIVTLSSGLDHIDKAFFNDERVIIINAPGVNSTSVAEHIFGLILNLKKRISEGNTLVHVGQGNIDSLSFLGNDLGGKTIGLIGAGSITREVARLAHAFNLNIFCHTKDEHLYSYMLDYGAVFVDLDYLLRNSDIVNILVPLLPSTRHLISKDKIKLMKTDATFINAARTEVVDTRALIAHADKHPNFKVGLDICVGEYADILSKPRHNVIVTPHIAGLTVESKQKIEDTVIESLIALSRQTRA